MTIWGVHMDQGYFSISEHEAELAAARETLNAQMGRHTLRWRTVEPSQSNFDWSIYDSIVKKSEAIGMDSMFMLATSPQWASGSSDQFVVPDAGSGVTHTFQTWASRYANFCAAAVSRYMPGGTLGTNVTHWEIWNEPNLYPSFWKGGSTNDPAQYAYLYDLAYTAIKAVDPTAKVGFGVTVEWEAAYTGPRGGKLFMDNVLAATGVNGAGRRDIEYMSVHMYAGVNNAQPPYVHYSIDQNIDDIAELRRWMDVNGLESAPIWVTEFGWNSDVVFGAQPFYIRDFLKLYKRRYLENYNITVMVAFAYKDGLAGNYGLLDSSLQLKDAGLRWLEEISTPSGIGGGEPGVQVKVVNMAMPTSTGNHTVSGVGFKPKAAIAFATGATATGGGDGNVGSYGLSDIIINRVMSWADDDGVSPTVNRTTVEQGLVRIVNGAGTEQAALTISSANDDGVVLNVSRAGSAYLMTLVFIGGEDITHVNCADVEWPASTTGSHRMTEIGWEPDVVFNVWTYQGVQLYPVSTSNLLFGVGVTDGSNQQLLGIYSQGGVATANVLRRHASNRMGGDHSSGESDISVTSGISTGLLVNRVSAVGTGTTGFFLAIKGGQWQVGQDTNKTTTGTKDTLLSFTPRGVIFQLPLLTGGDTTLNQNARWTFGASDGTNHGSYYFSSQGLVGTSNTAYGVSASKAIRDGSTSINSEATCSIGDSKFTLDWTTADATSRVFSYVAVGDVSRTQGGGIRRGGIPDSRLGLAR